MEIPLSELIDKMSIIKIKLERVDDENLIDDLKVELLKYQEAIESFRKRRINIDDSWTNKLYEINKKQWDLESEMNKAKNNGPDLLEMGKIYIKIQISNKERVSVKNEIIEKTGDGFKDIKIN